MGPDFYQTNPVNFMNFYLNAGVEKSISQQLVLVADTVRFAPLAIDVLPKNVSKGTAIGYLLERIARPEIETFAFGDQDNDLSMFQSIDHGIAMQHGSNQLKAQAAYVAETKNGVLKGFKHCHLIS